jgi:hypothetical protein
MSNKRGSTGNIKMTPPKVIPFYGILHGPIDIVDIPPKKHVHYSTWIVLGLLILIIIYVIGSLKEINKNWSPSSPFGIFGNDDENK